MDVDDILDPAMKQQTVLYLIVMIYGISLVACVEESMPTATPLPTPTLTPRPLSAQSEPEFTNCRDDPVSFLGILRYPQEAFTEEIPDPRNLIRFTYYSGILLCGGGEFCVPLRFRSGNGANEMSFPAFSIFFSPDDIQIRDAAAEVIHETDSVIVRGRYGISWSRDLGCVLDVDEIELLDTLPD